MGQGGKSRQGGKGRRHVTEAEASSTDIGVNSEDMLGNPIQDYLTGTPDDEDLEHIEGGNPDDVFGNPIQDYMTGAPDNEDQEHSEGGWGWKGDRAATVFYTLLSDASGPESDSAGGDPRQRARVGIKRRKFVNATTQKVRKSAGMLAHALGVWLTMLTSHTAQVVSRPIEDIWAVMQPKHAYPDDRDRADVLELFAGRARITEAFTRRRGAALHPRDLCFGHDLRKEEVQGEVLREIAAERPWLLWAAPPCTNWCAFARLNFSPQERRRRQRQDVVLLKFLDRAFALQTALGGHVVLENPLASEIWKHPLPCKWQSNPGYQLVNTDLCSFEMRSRDGQDYLKKPVKLLVSHPAFDKHLGRRCLGGHKHRHIGGQETAHSAHYTTAFGTVVYHVKNGAPGLTTQPSRRPMGSTFREMKQMERNKPRTMARGIVELLASRSRARSVLLSRPCSSGSIMCRTWATHRIGSWSASCDLAGHGARRFAACVQDLCEMHSGQTGQGGGASGFSGL